MMTLSWNKELVMKRALLLLVIACLLFTTQLSAAAYEPTNGLAIEANTYVSKIIAEEEVTVLTRSENMTPLVLGKNAWSNQYLLFVIAINFAITVAYIRSPTTEATPSSKEFDPHHCGFT